MTAAVAMALLLLACGIARAGDSDSELTVVNSPSPGPPALSVQEILRTAGPAIPAARGFVAPAASPGINFDPRRSFGDFVTGEKTERAFFTASLATMTALNAADYFSTVRALKCAGLGEGNPLLKPFVKNAAVFAAVKAGTTVLSVWGMNSLWKKDKTMAWILTTASNCLLSYVVANNLRLVRRAR